MHHHCQPSVCNMESVWVLGSLLVHGSRESTELQGWKGRSETALGIPVSDTEGLRSLSSWGELDLCLITECHSTSGC